MDFYLPGGGSSGGNGGTTGGGTTGGGGSGGSGGAGTPIYGLERAISLTPAELYSDPRIKALAGSGDYQAIFNFLGGISGYTAQQAIDNNIRYGRPAIAEQFRQLDAISRGLASNDYATYISTPTPSTTPGLLDPTPATPPPVENVTPPPVVTVTQPPAEQPPTEEEQPTTPEVIPTVKPGSAWQDGRFNFLGVDFRKPLDWNSAPNKWDMLKNPTLLGAEWGSGEQLDGYDKIVNKMTFNQPAIENDENNNGTNYANAKDPTGAKAQDWLNFGAKKDSWLNWDNYA